MFCTIINDCKDENAFGRQATRAAALLGCPVQTVGVKTDLEAAGNLIDMLDAAEGGKGVVLVNVAPRNGKAKKWPNGTPFGYFFHGETLIVTSIDGQTLSLVKKLGLVDTIHVFDIPTVMKNVAESGSLSAELANEISQTQFRSFQFTPRAAAWLLNGIDLPATPMPVSEIADAIPGIWWIDNFGNAKTSLLHGEEMPIDLPHYERLKDVPDGECAIVTGSSGIGNKRFLEIVCQGGNAAKVLGLKIGPFDQAG